MQTFRALCQCQGNDFRTTRRRKSAARHKRTVRNVLRHFFRRKFREGTHYENFKKKAHFFNLNIKHRTKLARFKLCKKVPMSVSNINSNDVPSVNEADGAKNEDQLKQYQDQYQQLLSQYGDASAAWSNTASDIKTDAGTSICTAIGNQLNETKKKLDAFQAAVNASESSEETLKTMAESCKASVSNVTAYIAMVPMTVADAADISALRKIWGGLSDADKTLLGSEFTQAIEAQFSAFNAKIVASQKAIAEGADASVIEKLQSEITELKTQLSALINGTTDGSIMSITDRIACLKLLEEA
jgi:archaellum component FlaC